MVVGFPIRINEANLDWALDQAKPEIALDIDGSDRMTVCKTRAHRYVSDLLGFGAKVVYQHHENAFTVSKVVTA